MTKFNFFLVVEALLLTLGLITIFNNDIIRFIFILVLTLLAVRFFNKESKSDFVLTICLISLFLVSMWNIIKVIAITDRFHMSSNPLISHSLWIQVIFLKLNESVTILFLDL